LFQQNEEAKKLFILSYLYCLYKLDNVGNFSLSAIITFNETISDVIAFNLKLFN